MAILKIKRDILQLIMYSTLMFLITSCGKEKAPDPARSENKLVFELFNTLENKDHKATLKKVERLRVLNPDNIFLANLENTERVNLVITEVNKKLKNDNLTGAVKYVKKTESHYPNLTKLKPIKDELEKLYKIKLLVDKTEKAKKAAQLRASIARLEYITMYKSKNSFLKAYLKSKRELAARMTIVESKRLNLLDLLLDIDYQYNEKDDNYWNDLAELAIEDPKSPALRHYMGILNGAIEPSPFILPKK